MNENELGTNDVLRTTDNIIPIDNSKITEGYLGEMFEMSAHDPNCIMTVRRYPGNIVHVTQQWSDGSITRDVVHIDYHK